MSTKLFTELPLCCEIQQALAEAQHVTATPIQAQAIPHVLEGRDLLGCAQTGTGKTAAFALPILHRLKSQPRKLTPRSPQVLILVPTRELAAQISTSFRTYGKHLRIRQTAIFGGVNQNPQVRALQQGLHVLVATPGRLIDLMEQGHVRLDQVKTLVLDEADRMFDMGFLPPLRKIISKLPEQRQALCFSATMPKEVAELVGDLLREPAVVEVAPQSTTNVQIEQQAIQVDQSGKRDALNKVLEAGDAHRVLVFTRTKRRADIVAKQLRQADVDADAIHGDKTQRARTVALDKFRTGRIRVLVATDVAARGIDVRDVSHVINYDLPFDAESYVHRIGRTGRASAIGIAISFVDPGERGMLRAIERLIGKDLLPREERGPRGSRPPVGDRSKRGGFPKGGRGPRRFNGDRPGKRRFSGEGQAQGEGQGASTERRPRRERPAGQEAGQEQQGGHQRQNGQSHEGRPAYGKGAGQGKRKFPKHRGPRGRKPAPAQA